MFNEIELNDEQLAEVAGGSTRTNIFQLANVATLQRNTLNANTNALAIGVGRNSHAQALAQGSNNTLTNTAVTLNGNGIS